MLAFVEVLAAIIILSYGVLMAKYLPPRHHYIANVIMVLIALGTATVFGVNLGEMGLGLNELLFGTIIGLAISAIIVLAVLISAAIRHVRPFFIGNPLTHAPLKRRIYESFIRIPLSTALVEELLFRGFFLGLLLQNNSVGFALFWSSVVFGLWHIAPTLNTLGDNQAAQAIAKRSKSHKFISVMGTVVTTAIAGALFSWLRLFTGSLATPWLVHWSINASGIAGGSVAKRVNNRARRKKEENE
jgi:tRNA pseudouridine32 synthase/23S rRNA pseudouridine746 synthase